MKAITLWQPFATLVAIGAKRIETRGWETSYRGPIAIHASKKSPPGSRALIEEEPFWSVLRSASYHQHNLPAGAIVATARLAAICEIVKFHDKRTTFHLSGPVEDLSPGVWALLGAVPKRPLSGLELAFGDFTEGRFAWILEDVAALGTAIPAKGRQGLWDWTPPAEPARAPAAPRDHVAPAESLSRPPASPPDLIEQMAGLAACDPRMQSVHTEIRQAFLRTFARDVIAARDREAGAAA